jgi:hypothetical protein
VKHPLHYLETPSYHDLPKCDECSRSRACYVCLECDAKLCLWHAEGHGVPQLPPKGWD